MHVCVFIYIYKITIHSTHIYYVKKKLILDEMNVLLYSCALFDSNQQCLKELRDTDHMLSKSTL